MNIFDIIIRRITYRAVDRGLDHIERRGCLNLNTMFWGALIFFGTVGSVIFLISKNDTKKTSQPKVEAKSTWQSLEVGDSLFLSRSNGITFYKKGRSKGLKNKKSIIDFYAQNKVDQRLFSILETTFVGICSNKDSTFTMEGKRFNHEWIRVLPSSAIMDASINIKRENKAFTWKWVDQSFDKTTAISFGSEFYIAASDVERKPPKKNN